jgi:short chain dehydrogenase
MGSPRKTSVCFDVNGKGTFFGAKAAIRQMLEHGDGGVIVDLVSTAGRQGHPSQSVNQPQPLPGDRVGQGQDPGQRDLPDLRQDVTDERTVRRQGLRPGLHRVAR